jgi:small subunit ribosomal protein S10
MQIARIKLSGRNPEQLNEICEEITGVAKKLGVNWRGPIPLPTKNSK